MKDSSIMVVSLVIWLETHEDSYMIDHFIKNIICTCDILFSIAFWWLWKHAITNCICQGHHATFKQKVVEKQFDACGTISSKDTRNQKLD
jgi:hypothetical protein